MSQLNLKPVLMEGFSIQPSLEPSALRIVLRGSADMEARPSLSQFIPKAHAEAERLAVAEVLVDVHELYFINSVCLKSLIVWINLIMNTSGASRYRLTFLVDPHLHWQDRSILALQRMAPDIVQVASWKGE
jgi:hypothetical protein